MGDCKMRDRGPLLRIGLLALAAAGLAAALFFSFAAEGSESPAGPVIAEVLTANSLYPEPDGRLRDWITLRNDSGGDVRLDGLRLTDGSGKEYRFPAGSLAPGEERTVFCGGTDGAPFGLRREGGETLTLVTRRGRVLDRVETVALEKNTAMCRTAEGWSVGRPGTGPAGGVSLRLSELACGGGAEGPDWRTDWIEIENFSSREADASGWGLSDREEVCLTLPEGTVIPAGGFLKILPGDAFGLSASGGETVTLFDSLGRVADEARTEPCAAGKSLARTENGWAEAEPTPGYSNDAAGRQAYLASFADGGVYVSEYLAVNAALPLDGELTDWLELACVGGEPARLEGRYLTDDPEEPAKYALPALTLEPGERLLVKCSEAGFRLSAGEEVVLTSAAGVEEDRFTVFGEKDVSVVRTGPDDPGSPAVYATPGYPETEEGYALASMAREAFTAENGAEILLWECAPFNDDHSAPDGGKWDYVELKNVSDAPAALGELRLTTDPAEPGCALPERTLEPGERIVLWLSGDASLSRAGCEHLELTLSAREERLYLLRGEETADCALLRGLPQKTALGRDEAGGGWGYVPQSPGAENVGWARLLSAVPVTDTPEGVYAPDAPLTVTLTAPGEIRYTLDGSEPTAESALCDGPLTLEKTTVIRAVSFEAGKRPSEILTLSYLLTDHTSLPAVSLVTAPENLFGRDGIYRNDWSHKDVEVPGHVAFFEDGGSFSLDCGVSIHGMTSLLVSSKKSFTLRFREHFGGKLRYDIFGEDEVNCFSSLMLRADVESTYSSFMRDNLFGYLGARYSERMMAMNIRFGVLYLNGEYWGIYTLREHYSPEYYADHMGCPAGETQMLKSFCAPGDSLWDLREWVISHSLVSDENYAYVCARTDPESWADWIIFEAYTGNIDVNGNMRYFRCEADGLWRCGLTDVDLGMFDVQTFAVPKGALQHGVIASALLQNADFRALVKERMDALLGGPMSDEAMCALIDSLAGELREEMPYEKERWGGTVAQWESMVRELKSYCTGRAAAMYAGAAAEGIR